jgi:hypothetical protein
LGFDDMKKFCDQNNEIYVRLMVLIPNPTAPGCLRDTSRDRINETILYAL